MVPVTRRRDHGGPPERIWAVVTARMGSERMRGKSMAMLAGRPAFVRIVERLRWSRLLDGIVLATTVNTEDDALRAAADALAVPHYSGSVNDVLGRTVAAARSVAADIIVQITGDCPLIDPRIVDRVIASYLRHRPDYASNIQPPSYPNGMDTEVFAAERLAEVDQITTDPKDREHPALHFYEHPDRFRLLNIEAPPEQRWPELRLTLDTLEDHALISAVYEELAPRAPIFLLPDILAYLRRRPDLVALNSHIQQKAAR